MASDDPQQIDLKIPYRERISRLFIFRPLWMFILMWIIIVWVVWIYIVFFLHFWYMLILGKRSEWLWGHVEMFVRYVTRWYFYLYLLVDKRPSFFSLD